MSNTKVISTIKKRLKREFLNEPTGHDWWHIYRVYKLSLQIIEEVNQPVNKFIVELAALLHDVDDWKFSDDSQQEDSNKARDILVSLEINPETINEVLKIIKEISFKGANVETPMSSLGGMIVQDADRLDALGAIGIARTFAYGGKSGRPIYDPDIPPSMHNSFSEYKNNKTHSLNHFYEKLFLLQDRLNTEAGKKIGEARTKFMQEYVKQFLLEWNLSTKD